MDESVDDMAVWNLVRPLIRAVKPKDIEVSIYNGGDIVETRAHAGSIPGLTRGFELKPNKKGLSCPSLYEEIRVDVYLNGSEKKPKTETRVSFRTKGSRGTENAWLQHKTAVEDLLPKGIYMAEKCVVQKLLEDEKAEIKKLQELLVRAKGVVRD